MKKRLFMLLAGLLAIFALTACGTKSQEDVVKELGGKVEELKGYKAEAKMTLQMGTEPQTYAIEIWHKKPDYYRVSLKNPEKNQSQMILRNEEGVFVLTPALNKSFKFQSDWPQNSSQAYLYESLLQDILEDKEAKFNATKKHYVFETKTRYQNNKMLPYQEITLDKKDLAPVSVKVMDSDRNPLVTVDFSKVDFKAALDKKDFDTQKNMTGAQIEVPVMAEEAASEEFSVKYPQAELENVSLIDEKEISMEDGKRFILTYGGDKSFTLIQEKANVMPANTSYTSESGEPVDLGFTIGAIDDNKISWTHGGVEYIIASSDLTREEMVMLAQSVQGDAVK
ncbi:outer membrane lipoprotein carrier protein LolA [Bacillus infantis]|uniref:LolA family protein n=1 Tax=Bacillus infantis TaxID=324767 RepID=UPI00101C58FF|nr:outer membrane lipoprotein carrier protein LolA [Bacillus infantis]RYI25673.1 outer membrane lipoprotein carrier protein LolA [Bacillus infantis]